MKLLTLVVIALCITAGCCREVETNFIRQLLKSASARSESSAESTPGGRAATTAAASSTGGTAEAVAHATSEAFKEISNQLVEYFKFVDNNLGGKTSGQTDEDYCENALAVIENELKAVGNVTASAYTEAMAQAEVTGEGAACAEGNASAEAQASGYAQILVDAITEASIGVSESRAQTSVDAVSEVIAGAFATAFATACVEGEGSAFALQTSLAEAVAMPVASVSVLVASGVDCTGQKGYARSEVEASADVDEKVAAETTSVTTSEGNATTTTIGEAEATTGLIDQCSGTIYYLCCRVSGDVCTCSRTSTPQCHAVKESTDTTTYWYDEEEDFRCTCDRRISIDLIVT